jgi:hypothetical protein
MKYQVSIEMLERIVKNAKSAKAKDSSLSNTVELDFVRDSHTHLGTDQVGAWLKSGYAECNGELLFNHWK